MTASLKARNGRLTRIHCRKCGETGSMVPMGHEQINLPSEQAMPPELPEPTYVERVLAAFERYPKGARFVVVLAILYTIADVF